MNVLITGASKGIGKAISLELANRCNNVIMVSRSHNLLYINKNEIEEINPSCKTFIHSIDITIEPEIVRCLKETQDEIGYLDVLINCAGKSLSPSSIQEISLDDWNEVFNVNITAPFLFTKYSLPLLRKARYPTIINIASTAGISSRPGWSAYAASKSSLINFSNTISAELKDYGISVFCVAPGRTATELRRQLVPDEDQSRIMQPEQVAKFVNFLISKDGKILSGNTTIIRDNQ